LDHRWHLDCWKCSDCGVKYFNGTSLDPYYHKADQTVCGTCAEKGGECEGCKEKLSYKDVGGVVSAFQKFWHPKCFLCMTCKKILLQINQKWEKV